MEFSIAADGLQSCNVVLFRVSMHLSLSLHWHTHKGKCRKLQDALVFEPGHRSSEDTEGLREGGA